MANPVDGSQTADPRGDSQQPGQEITIDNGYDIARTILRVSLKCPESLKIGEDLETSLMLSIDSSVGGLEELYTAILQNPKSFIVPASVSFRNCKVRASVESKICFGDMASLFAGGGYVVKMPNIPVKYPGTYTLVGKVYSNPKPGFVSPAGSLNVSEAKLVVL
jgi:hypothetical protein